MEIKYESFSKWRNIALDIEKLIPYDIVTPGDIYAYIINEPNKIEESVQERLIETAKNILNKANSIHIQSEVQSEIKLNIANIVNNNGVIRYLKYIHQLNLSTIEMLESYFDYERIEKIEHRLTMFDVMSFGITRHRELLKQMTTKTDDGVYELTDTELLAYEESTKRKNDVDYDALGYLLFSFINTLNCYKELQEFISDKLSIYDKPIAEEDPNSNQILNEKIDDILSQLIKLGYGQEIIFNEIEELRNLQTKLSKKSWAQLLKGKLVDLILSELLPKNIAKTVYEFLTDEHFKLLK